MTSLEPQYRRIHFVTGRLAERALRETLTALAPTAPAPTALTPAAPTPTVDFSPTLQVLPITVAALMTTRWIGRHVRVPRSADAVMIPGYCQGDLEQLSREVGVPVLRGPRDLRKLPEYFGQSRTDDYGEYDIEILAEINHAPRLELGEVLSEARRLADAGADVIDVGCDPGESWSEVGRCVRALRDQGHRVSIDSLDAREIEAAARAGAELVLSVNSTNRHAAPDWGCEVVAIPDDPSSLAGLEETVEFLARSDVPLRIDPIVEPIGCGFARSLARYVHARDRFPDAEMLMGIGNLTELTDCDSAAVNVLLMGFCQELGIRSVLTTQVINWARSSVRECDVARRLVHHAVRHGVPPKNRENRLVMLRDPAVPEHGDERLDELARQIKDANYRVFAEGGRLHLISAASHLHDDDPFRLFERLLERTSRNLDVGHAFYLGYELAKATTALTLDKQYQQDESLDWGILTRPETSHRVRLDRRPTGAEPSEEWPSEE